MLPVLGALCLGIVLEYKLEWLDKFQTYLNQTAVLPVSPTSFNARSGEKLGSLEPLPLEPVAKGHWREEARSRILKQIRGSLAPSSAVTYRIEFEIKHDDLAEKRLTIASFDGQLIPATLFAPVKQVGALPAVLVVPGHTRSGESGLLQLSEIDSSYQHAAARKIAEAGFVTLAFELRGFGYLGEPQFPEHKAVAYNALQRGESYKSLILKDAAVAMALLRALPQVDAVRTGITGASYGGEIAVQYAALDPQVAAVSFHSFGGRAGKVKPVTSGNDLPHFCHLFPAVDGWMHIEHWFWLLAPRPTHGIRGLSNQRGFVESHELYARGWDRPEDLKLQVESGGHEFFVEAAIAFFKSRL